MILFIDDDANGTKPYQTALQEAGYTLKMVGNPDEALDVLEHKASSVDFVILDIYMPFGKHFTRGETRGGLETGLRLLEHLREKYPATPVLVFSISNMSELGTEYAGPKVYFMAKGDLPSEFISFVKDTFGEPRTSGEAT